MADEKAPPKKAEKPDKAEQAERFKETARRLGADETGEAFDKTLRRIIRRPNP